MNRRSGCNTVSLFILAAGKTVTQIKEYLLNHKSYDKTT